MEGLSSLCFSSSSSPPIVSSPLKLFSLPAIRLNPCAHAFARSSASQPTASPRRRKPRTSTPKPERRTVPSPVPTVLETVTGPGTTSPPRVPTKKVLIPIGYGTEEMEAVVLIDVLRRAGADVVVASVETHLQVEASGGVNLVADICISECCDEIFDLIAIPGGMPGAARLRDCQALREITTKHAEERRLYGAICAAPAVTLLPWGLLKRKQTTCHPAFHDKLPTFWAVKSKLQVSGELTTSRGPGTSFEFALSFVDQLFGESVAREIGQFLMVEAADKNPKTEEFNKIEWSIDHTPCVLIPIANGCEEIEVVTTVDILRRAKVDVVLASVEKTLQVSASHGTKIVADKLITDTSDTVHDLIILPGGTASSERLQKSRVLKKLLKEQDSGGRIYGAMCSSLAVLHRHGLLRDKRATYHPSILNGVDMTDEGIKGTRVVIDGRVITGQGLASSVDFVLAIVKKLFGHGRARSVAEGLVFDYPRS
ncbi:hypothetical protein SAY87_020933 [Trapa incisa]|uniref:DJ-1/PfpI domain-containing protein n=1 Tax=Trapa incisa TaxID=236973 RepID=A0AAN7PV25_9MYRT|nr:hypothetical protein SAY87_020933 [Trapa incisa]